MDVYPLNNCKVRKPACFVVTICCVHTLTSVNWRQRHGTAVSGYAHMASPHSHSAGLPAKHFEQSRQPMTGSLSASGRGCSGKEERNGVSARHRHTAGAGNSRMAHIVTRVPTTRSPPSGPSTMVPANSCPSVCGSPSEGRVDCPPPALWQFQGPW